MRDAITTALTAAQKALEKRRVINATLDHGSYWQP